MTGSGGRGFLHLDLKRIHLKNGVESEDTVAMPFIFLAARKLTIKNEACLPLHLLNNREKGRRLNFQLVLECQMFLIN